MTLRTIGLGIATTISLALFGMVSVGSTGVETFDAAKTYKGKCVACHGPKAEKKFDTAKSDDEHIQIILKGKKGEKPPNMPAYETKGVTADQVKALLDYMKSLRQ